MKIKNILWGLVLIIIGILLGLNSLEIIKFNIFFSGWWTLFIIIPSFIGLITDLDKTSNFIGLLIGCFLLLASLDIIDFALILKLLLPIIFVIIGVSLMCRKKYDDKKKMINEDNEHLAIFSGQTINYDKEKLEKLELTALFGGIKCDLRNSLIKEDVYIDATAFFGGIDLLVPENVKVKVKPFAIFGGVETKKLKANDKEKPVIYINATCVFGGIDVKHE